MEIALSFLELLRLHHELDELFLAHQEALLSLDISCASEILKRYEAKLLTHMREEEELLIPLYQARAETIPGGPVELFLGEHKKMRRFVTEFHETLSRLVAEKSARLRQAVIGLLDRQFMYKHLVEHHDLREKNILYPWLDRVTSEEERARLLERCLEAENSPEKNASFFRAACHEHHHFEKATEALKQEHRVIEKVLTAVEKLANTPGPVPLGLWEKAIDFIRNFADKCHHLKEEKIFFPALEERGIPREGGPIGMMLMEHEEGRGYVRLMAAALLLAEEDPKAAETSLLDNARAYLRLLRQHIPKEDEILFPMADEVLTQEDQNKLLREFEEHEAKEIGLGVHERYLKLARELEQFV